MSIWPDVGLVQAYGQTEMAPIVTTLSMEDHLAGGNKLKSAGRPTAVTDIRVVDEEGLDCGLNVSGEIIARGPHNMLGYWNKPEATAETLKDGWLYTNDLCTVDADGFITICDRKKDMVISGGENIYPAELENVLAGSPEVQEAAVIGLKSEKWGEVGNKPLRYQNDGRG